MLIKSIEMINFRQFKGKQRIEFSRDENRNITLILGDNTSGKTTLLQAFLWCLYGVADFKTKDALLNQMVAQEMVFNSKNMESISITIELMHQDIEYIITRKQNFYLRNRDVKQDKISDLKVSYKKADGQTKTFEGNNKKNTIDEILPEDLSGYFFYDTERFGNISDKSDVTEAVKKLLGLTVLENTRNHIGRETQGGTVLGILNASLSDKDDDDAKKARLNYEEAEEKMLDTEERIQEAEKQKEVYDNKITVIQETLKNMPSSSKLQIEKEEKERLLQNEKNWLSSEEKNFLRRFNDKPYLFFLKPLLHQAIIKLKDANISDKGITDMNAKSIRHIIQRGTCVCGTVVEENSQSHKYLLEELEFLPPKSIGLLLNGFKESINAYQNAESAYSENLLWSYTEILKNKKRISNLEEEIKSISEKIKANISSASYEKELEENRKKITELGVKISRFYIFIGEQEQIIRENKKRYQSTIGVSEKNREIRLHMAYAKEIYDWVDKSYSKKEQSIRVELEKKINEYFNKIYHGNRRVEIDDRYRVSLITTSGNEEIRTDESQGLETVKNFSFIAGLVDLAKSKLTNTNDEVNIDTEAYPLILDAPFSNADAKHVTNISKVLPEVAEQLILIVMSKDWDYAEKEMGLKVGKRYILDKKSEIHTVIEEVN
ncbi:AAA family ATPase [Sporosarcina sp. CAU 1771]